jgi:ectoine hydroxylase-related dioxygenase (phytanoyl-CoA dioxygenase family)
MHVDEQTIEQFQRDGVIVLRDALNPAELQAALSAWQWSIEHPGPLASGLIPGSDKAFQDLCNPHASAVYEPVVRNTQLASIAQQFWGGSAVWFLYEQVFHKRGENVPRTPWHQDTSYWSLNGSELIGFWLSIEAIPIEAALEFVRGSHRGTLFNTSRFDSSDPTLPIFDVASDHPGYLPPLPDIDANRDEHDIVAYATEPGDVIAFHTSTLHGGGATHRSTPERRTLTLRFFGEDCRIVHSPGPPAPFGKEIGHLAVGDPLRHSRFLKLLDSRERSNRTFHCDDG